MKKIFKNKSGDILVRYCSKDQIGRCGIVEMLHLHDKKRKAGCVIGYWEVNIDEDPTAEFKVIDSRLTEVKYDFDIIKAIKYGQKIADKMINKE